MTLLPSLLASAVKLPSSITLFTNQMAAASGLDRVHVSMHPSIAMAMAEQPQDSMSLLPHPLQLKMKNCVFSSLLHSLEALMCIFLTRSTACAR